MKTSKLTISSIECRLLILVPDPFVIRRWVFFFESVLALESRRSLVSGYIFAYGRVWTLRLLLTNKFRTLRTPSDIKEA
jgi:hypothetical protein